MPAISANTLEAGNPQPVSAPGSGIPGGEGCGAPPPKANAKTSMPAVAKMVASTQRSGLGAEPDAGAPALVALVVLAALAVLASESWLGSVEVAGSLTVLASVIVPGFPAVCGVSGLVIFLLSWPE